MNLAATHPLLRSLVGAPDGSVAPAPTTEDGWAALLSEASAHGLAGLLARLPGLPEPVGAALRRDLVVQTARNLALAGELRRILEGLDRTRVRCVPLRGPALAESLWGDLGARPMGDLDLLVERTALDTVGGILESTGFEEMDRRPGFAAAHSYTLKFFKRDPFMVIVEPHWTIVYPPFVGELDMREVWARCEPCRVAGAPALALAPEDTIVHLALHLAHRDVAPLLWWHELDLALRRQADRLDWELVARVGGQSGVAGILAEVLSEAACSLRSPVPAATLAALRRGAASAPASIARRLAQTPSIREREGLAQLLVTPGLGGKLRYAGALLFPRPRFMMLQYDLSSRRQLIAAYARRIGGFLWQGAAGMARLVARSAAVRR